MFNIDEAQILAEKIYKLLAILKTYYKHSSESSNNEAFEYLLEQIFKLADRLNVQLMER